MAKTVMNKSVLCELELKKGFNYCTFVLLYNDRISFIFLLVIKSVEFMPFSTNVFFKKNCQYFACFKTVAVNSPI